MTVHIVKEKSGIYTTQHETLWGNSEAGSSVAWKI